MGIAIADAAREAGWDVTLLLGPVCTPPPHGVRIEFFTSTDDLSRQLEEHFALCDVLIMAAAVADYRPIRHCLGSKLPRGTGNMVLELEATPDLVAACTARKRPEQRIVGFALEEPAKLEERAAKKLHEKKLDAIVANPLETMGSGLITARIFMPGGAIHMPTGGGTMDKQQFARWLVDWIDVQLLTLP